jgi:diguanylate cyclase (GGDEF)-like protein
MNPSPEAAASSLGALFAALNCVAVEVDGDGLHVVSPVLPWLQSIEEADTDAPNIVSLLPYLELFLVDARPFWRLGKPGCLHSDFWTQNNAAGNEVHLLAFATLIEGRKLIVIRTADELYQERQRWQLYAHQTAMQLKTIERLKSELEETAIALQTANERLSELSIRDDLTGLYNRRYFDHNFRQELSRAVRTGESLSVLFMDIDKFKVLNDTYGHSVGDNCLRAVAEVLTAAARRFTDTVARFGGEEFAVLLPATEAADAFLIATEISKGVRALNFPNEHSGVEPYVTASLGAYTRQPDGYSTIAQILESVDAALYQAKKEGRNRVIVATSLNDPTNPTSAAEGTSHV